MDLEHLFNIGLIPRALLSVKEAPAQPAAARALAAMPAAEPALAAATTPAAAAAAAPAGLCVHPRGTPLDGNDGLFSVLSYNLLAPAFVRPIDKRTGNVQGFAAFQWAEPAEEVLDWDARWPRLLAELRTSKADVICLQEVQFERPEGGEFVLPGWLALEGYAAKLPMQGALRQMAERNLRVLDNEVAIGAAVLYRTDRLEVFDSRNTKDPNTRVAACLRGRRGSALEALGRTVVVSLHLDAKSEEKRVEQLKTCAGLARQLGVREMVIAGDLNTECLPGSCVGAFVAGTPEPTEAELARECAVALRVTSGEGDEPPEVAEGAGEAGGPVEPPGPTAAQLQEWAALWKRAAAIPGEHRMAFSHVPTGATRAAYDHGKLCGPCVTWRLDHIFYTPRTLALCGSWATLEADPASAAAGLPNRSCPSDHLPVAALFRPSPTPALDEARTAELLRQLGAVEERHASEQQALKEELEKLEPAPPPAGAAPAAAEPSTPPPSKKAKKKNERPSAEMQALIQERRRRLREQKERHARERRDFVAGLGELEQDALDQSLCSASWVETGERRKG
mmetsp:Transcript_91820/g.285704  ORF Transcript_91820/g.285704 Transcript_91820/m.285704 type:complete len:565 (-) Transcript_91820:28-1722(-)